MIVPNGKNAEVAGMFLLAAGNAFNIYGTMNSSPWTAENFGADEEKAASCREYVRYASIINVGLGIGASIVAQSWAPLLGILGITVLMYWIYERALRRGATAGTNGWANG